MAQHILQEQDVGLDPPDVELKESALHALHRAHIAAVPCDHLTHKAVRRSEPGMLTCCMRMPRS